MPDPKVAMAKLGELSRRGASKVEDHLMGRLRSLKEPSDMFKRILRPTLESTADLGMAVGTADLPAEGERIAAAALKHPDGRIAFDRSHLEALDNPGFNNLNESDINDLVDGWLTTKGRFVSREEAGKMMTGVKKKYLHSDDLIDQGIGLPGYKGTQQGVLSKPTTAQLLKQQIDGRQK